MIMNRRNVGVSLSIGS